MYEKENEEATYRRFVREYDQNHSEREMKKHRVYIFRNYNLSDNITDRLRTYRKNHA
jgi:hypothetical protein